MRGPVVVEPCLGCGIGSWGGRCLSLAPSVKLSGPEEARGWAAELRMALMLTTLLDP